MEPYRPPEALTRGQVVDLITPASDAKAQHYSRRGAPCYNLDLLVYVNRNAVLETGSPQPTIDVLLGHRWRSVSALIPPHSYVVHAADDAPLFLRQLAGEPRAEWPKLFGLFDI